MTRPAGRAPGLVAVVASIVVALSACSGHGEVRGTVPGPTFTAMPTFADRIADEVGVEVGAGPDVLAPEQPWWTASGAEVEGSIAKTFRLYGDVTFERDEAVLRPGAASQLAFILSVLLERPDAHVEIAGYTDSDGASKHGLALSRERAEAVKAWLVSRGAQEESISAVGYGEADPVAPNDTEANKARNRRCEITVTEEG